MGGSKKRKAAKKKKASEPNNIVIVQQQQQQNNENDEVKERDSDGGEKEVVSPEGNQQLRRGELERRDDELPPVDRSNASETTSAIGGEEIVGVECSEAVEEDYNKCVALDDTLVSSGEMNDGVENSLEYVSQTHEYVVEEDTKTMLHTSSKLEQAASISPPAIDPETFHKQPLVGAPDQKSSWLGCCGMFDLLRGGR